MPFYPTVSLTPELRDMFREIRQLDSQLDGCLLSGDDYRDLALDAYASNTHRSTKIEGNRMTFEEVRTLATEFTSGRIRESPNGPSQEILNHLGFLFRDKLDLPWDIGTVLYVHKRLMTGVGDIEPGTLREKDVCVRGSDGTEYFIACPTSSVHDELTSLMEYVNSSLYVLSKSSTTSWDVEDILSEPCHG